MSITYYNKLVRDKIPEIIAENGEKPNIRFLDRGELQQHLEGKLDEEVGEYHKDKTVEELADILEVVFALAETNGCSREELLQAAQNKHDVRGGFSKGVFLISKED